MKGKIIDTRVWGKETHKWIAVRNGEWVIVQPTFEILDHIVKFKKWEVDIKEVKETWHGTLYNISQTDKPMWFWKEHIEVEEDFI
jgi:hypothetical protein